MIVPLFLEQLLVMFVGLADTLVVSYAGESAVSGVSLVNQFNTIFIYLFTALASGGAVVISQYIGRQETEHAGESASQLLMFSVLLSVLLGVAVLLGVTLQMGVIGIAFAMVCDWVVRAVLFFRRERTGKWKAFQVIK